MLTGSHSREELNRSGMSKPKSAIPTVGWISLPTLQLHEPQKLLLIIPPTRVCSIQNIYHGDAVGGGNFSSFSFQPLRAIRTSDSNLTYVFVSIHLTVVYGRLQSFAVVCGTSQCGLNIRTLCSPFEPPWACWLYSASEQYCWAQLRVSASPSGVRVRNRGR